VNNIDYFISKKSITEFDFYNEEGSGLGPTLEYYSLISQAITNPALKLFRNTEDNSLFPAPYDTEEKQKYSTEQIFELVGVLVARGILDGRIIQFNIN